MANATGFDPILAVETMYRTDLSSSDWLNAAMTSLQPLLDPGHNGFVGGFYECQDPLSFVPAPVLNLGCSDRLLSVFYEGAGALNENYVTEALLAPGITRCAAIEGWSAIPPVRDGALKALGFVDARSVTAIEPDGGGLCLAVFHTEPAVWRRAEKLLVYNVFRHLLAAHRLQRRLRWLAATPAGADAVLDPGGRLQHVSGSAPHAEARQALSRAVRASEKSRGARRRRDPLRALGAWESLVMERWTFVDHFDHDGRRYILALENARQAFGLELLSSRENEVVERALSGSHNKAIAYDLGLSHSTVKVLMSRAAFKLRVRTRDALLAKLRTLRNSAQ